VTINEHTPDKYQKLKKVVHASLPSNIPTRLTGWDTLKFGVNETAQYDRVLLDCPCSDERRVFNDEKLVKKWTDKVRVDITMLQVKMEDIIRFRAKMQRNNCYGSFQH